MKNHIILFLCMFSCLLSAQEGISDKWAIYRGQNQDSSLLKSGKQNRRTVALLKLHDSNSRHRLKKQGIEILRVLDRQHYIVATSTTQFLLLKETYPIWYANHQWKLSPTLLQHTATKKGDYIIKSNNPEKTMAHIKRMGKIKIIKKSKNLIHVRGKQAILEKELLPREEVMYLGKESFRPKLESTVRDLNPAINNITKIYQEFPNLKGEGRVISLKDNKFKENDIDLINKLVNSPLISATVDDHATDMATIISGLGNSSIKGRGVAFGASIQLSDFSNLAPDENTFLSNNNIFIQNHSYGTEIENFYGSLAAAYDEHVYQNPKELHVFSSGNAGATTPENGVYQGIPNYANLTGNFKMSKNTLSIGAVDEENNILPFASVGPAYDGRIKPELVAYSIIGTSNSAALTSGISGLLQEYFSANYGENALASLLRAVLINSADDIGAKGPDFISGYGNINAYNALKTLENNHFINGTIDQGSTEIFEINLPNNIKNFKATLVWTDVPAEINSNLALVNDLDLLVASQNSSYEPWVLNSEANSTSLESPAQRGADHINTIEQVYIENPNIENLELRVSGFDITTDNQEFSIAYGWEEANSFTWNYPLANDNFPYDGETASYFRWESSFTDEEGELAISYDNGTTWETIESRTTLSSGHYLWSAPENVTLTAQLKMTVDGSEFISDSFTISNVSTLGVGLDCDDILQLRWNKQEAVTEYNIYNLKDNVMQLTAVTSDTTYVFDKTEIASNYFAVQSVLPNEKLGVLSVTIDYTDLEAGCYQSFILSEISEDSKAAQLNILLSSLFNVATVAVEKKIGNSFETIASLQDLNSTNLVYLDQQPIQGLNTYRLNVILTDGTSFLSAESDLFFLTTLPFITFPNPVTDGINIFSKDLIDAEIWMEIYSLDGRLLITKKVASEQDFILLDELRQGLYAITIYSSKGDRLEKLIYKL
ncbi:MAG: S8 family serine peptidase [Saonia sp.]